MTSYNIVLAGVGGQGVVLASKLLMEESIARGQEVKGAETHGMAQRGASVVAHIRSGPCHSPLVIPGTAHLVIALESTEGLRNFHFLRPRGIFVVNAASPAFIGDEVAEHLRRNDVRVLDLDATDLAARAGLPRAVNMILLGFAAARRETPFEIEGLRSAVERATRPQQRDSCLAALAAGHAEGARADA